MLTREKIRQAIIGGESLFVEFKEKIGRLESLVAEIAAFANTEGGMVIFGVNDRGEIVGLAESQKLEEGLMNIVRQNISPVVSVNYSAIKINNRLVAALEIPKSLDRPHQTAQGVFYLRVGTTKRKASREELARIFQDAGLSHYDLSAVRKSSLQDIDLVKVNEYFHQVYQRDIYDEALPIEQLLNNMEIIKEDNNNVLATVGGILCFGKEPQKYLPQAIIQIARIDGGEISDPLLDKKEIDGVLPEQLIRAEEFIKLAMNKISKLEGVRRIYEHQYPLAAVREVLVNAVAHRNYSIAGANIRVLMFGDRLEVCSPGGLPNTVTLENIAYTKQARNNFISNVLIQKKMMESIGSGISKVIRFSKEQSGLAPKFELLDSQFKVTLFGKNVRE